MFSNYSHFRRSWRFSSTGPRSFSNWRQSNLHSSNRPTTLQLRSTWHEPNSFIPIVSLVLLVDKNSPPLFCKMYHITGIHKSSDGLSRICTLKTAAGTFERTVQSLCLVPVDVPTHWIERTSRPARYSDCRREDRNFRRPSLFFTILSSWSVCTHTTLQSTHQLVLPETF